MLQVQPDPDADSEEIDRRARRLLQELRDLEAVDSAELARDVQGVPEGAKVAEAVTLGAIAVSVLPTAVGKLLEFLQTWAARGQGQLVKLKALQGDKTIEVEFSPRQMSPEDLRRYVDVLTLSPPGSPSPR
jgi:hypothetical protein